MLAVVLAAVGGLWLASATQDLPYIHHPDEPMSLRVIDRMVDDGDANPHFFWYPSTFLYVHAALDLRGPVLGWLGGKERAPVTEVLGTTKTVTPGSVEVHRAVSVLMGLLTVAAVYGTTRVLTRRTGAALGAAVVMATSVTLGVNARLITPDVMAAALVACTLWASGRLWLRPTWAAHVSAGALAGLAASAKYNAAVVVVTVVAAAALSPGWRGRALVRATKLGTSGLAAAAVFLVTTPYALLDRAEFLRGMEAQRHHYATGHVGMDGHAASWYAHYLLSTETLLVSAAALGTVIALLARRWRPLVLLSTFPVVYGAFVASQAVRNNRTILLALPNLAVLAGLGGAVLLERVAPPGLGVRSRRTVVAALALVLGVAVLGPEAADLVDSIGLGMTTTWARSREWIQDNIPQGSSLYIEAYSPWVDPSTYEVTATRYLIGAPDALDGDYLVVSEGAYGRFFEDPERFSRQVRAYRTLLEHTRTVARFSGDGPTIQILRPRT